MTNTRFTADRLLLFGATGDLSQRMLLPSLCALAHDGLLSPGLRIVGTASISAIAATSGSVLTLRASIRRA